MARQQPQQLPQIGDRIGVVCGPGELPLDNPGTVINVYANRWYANNAEILMDDGSTRSMVGAYTSVGIGVYFLGRCGDYMPITWLDARPYGGELGYCIGPLSNSDDEELAEAGWEEFLAEEEFAYEERVRRSYEMRGLANIY